MDAPDPYEQVADEIDAGQIDKPLWVRSFAENNGDDAKTKATYIQYRAQKVRAIYQQAIVEAQRQERLRAERERKEAAESIEKERRQAARRNQEDAARAVAAHWRIANEEREAKWRAEAERQRWHAEYWTGTRRAIAWAWSLIVVGGVLWLASGVGTPEQVPAEPTATATPTATAVLIAPAAEPIPTAAVAPTATVGLASTPAPSTPPAATPSASAFNLRNTVPNRRPPPLIPREQRQRK